MSVCLSVYMYVYTHTHSWIIHMLVSVLSYFLKVSCGTDTCHLQSKTSIKFPLEQAMKAQGGSRSIALLFLQSWYQIGVLINTTPQPLYLRGKWPDIHYTEGWVSARASLDRYGKTRPTGIRSLDRPARRRSLYWLLGFNCFILFNNDCTAGTPGDTQIYVNTIYISFDFKQDKTEIIPVKIRVING